MTSPAPGRDVWSDLDAVDAAIDAAGARHSLDPRRARARRYAEVLEQSAADGSPALRGALARGLSALGRAILREFPENLFWDVDRLVAALIRDAAQLDEPVASIDERFATLCELHARYGRHTVIRFRYVHDFAYGYDWAKWVSRSPDERHGTGPFDARFLAYMIERADQLEALIASDDAKYPKLRDARPRNPFPFSREPDAELELHRALAAHDEIPVPMWDADLRRFDEPDRWDRPWATLRERRAVALGLGEPPA